MSTTKTSPSEAHEHLHPPPALVVRDLVERALREDLSRGDLTTEACIARDTKGAAVLVARHDLVLSGLGVFQAVFEAVDPGVEVELKARDGGHVKKGATAARVTGLAASILMAERTALNFAQRMSGVATKTASYVAALPKESHTRICDTRKTTPGLRALERYAVRCGGGHNHRDDLGTAVLIKDNHIAAAGGVRLAIERAFAHAPHTARVECEVDTMAQLDEALEAMADIIMLDNVVDATLHC